MQNILVIADDLTGAGEIAGIAQRYGLKTRLVRGHLAEPEPGVTVVDTDTRLMTPSDASETSRKFVRKVPPSHFERKDEKLDREGRAKAICMTCSVRHACLEYAVKIKEPHGIWGGLNELERKQLLTHRGL